MTKTFVFNNKKYNYFDHLYNTTLQNERSIEVPIVLEILKRFENRNVLEVGNVLSHYFDITHEIIDKHEKSEGVKNIDINNFKPTKKYDLIICISTIEHISKDQKVLLNTLNHLKSLLRRLGELVISFPIGFNKSMDKLLKEERLFSFNVFYMKRVDMYEWIQSNYNDVKNSKHCSPYPSGNGIVIMIFKKV